MAFIPPIPLIRRRLILRRLLEAGATSPETAKTLAEAGVLNPWGFPGVTRVMLRRGLIGQTPDGRFYLR